MVAPQPENARVQNENLRLIMKAAHINERELHIATLVRNMGESMTMRTDRSALIHHQNFPQSNPNITLMLSS